MPSGNSPAGGSCGSRFMATVKAWALSATDTLSAPVNNGAFDIENAKAGTYNIIIEAQDPYANTRKKDVVVTDGQTTDVGEIHLQQK